MPFRDGSFIFKSGRTQNSWDCTTDLFIYTSMNQRYELNTDDKMEVRKISPSMCQGFRGTQKGLWTRSQVLLSVLF